MANKDRKFVEKRITRRVPSLRSRDFDEASAITMAGAKRTKSGKNKGHLSSRDPVSGAIFKSKKHPTVGKTAREERKMGNVMGSIRGELVSFPTKRKGFTGRQRKK